MLDLKEVNLSETRFYQDVLQKGREEGREEGREQGLQREVVGVSLPEVIWFYDGLSGGVGCWGSITSGRLRQRQELVRSLTITQLEALGDALLDFNGMEDLEAWFEPNLSPN
jgi:predicted transposase YdaD